MYGNLIRTMYCSTYHEKKIGPPCVRFCFIGTRSSFYNCTISQNRFCARQNEIPPFLDVRHYILLLLPFLSFYWIKDIEVFMKKTINDTIDFVEQLVQQFFESLLCYSASARVLRWGHIIWVKDLALLAQRFLSYSPPF